MKFVDTRGREHFIDLRPSKWKVKEEGRGKYQSEVGEIVKALFPNELLLEEFPCLGEGLFLDFFMPKKKIAVEVQGQQHSSYNAFFHKDKSDFILQQRRDVLKQRWCDANKIKLVHIPYGSKEETVKALLF